MFNCKKLFHVVFNGKSDFNLTNYNDVFCRPERIDIYDTETDKNLGTMAQQLANKFRNYADVYYKGKLYQNNYVN